MFLFLLEFKTIQFFSLGSTCSPNMTAAIDLTSLQNHLIILLQTGRSESSLSFHRSVIFANIDVYISHFMFIYFSKSSHLIYIPPEELLI